MAGATGNEHVREGAAQVVAPPGGTGADAGAYDTAANRNIFINLVNEMRTVLIQRSRMTGSATSNNNLGAVGNENIRAGAAQVAAPVGGTGAAAGAYDTAGNRDICIALINEMRNVLIQAGMMTGSATSANNLGQVENEHVRESALQVAAPVGGTGATAGGYDSAANRNICINLVNEMRATLIDKGWMTGAA